VTRRAYSLLALSAAFLLASLAAPLAAPLAAQMGYPPAKSPYEDLRGRHAITIAPGILLSGDDPAGVGPGNGLMVSGRYEYLLTGPLWLVTRMAYAPSLERTVKDPEAAPAARVVGTTTEPLFLMDAGLGFNLTGNKSWHRLATRVTASLGFAPTFDSHYDLGNYRFGTKMLVSYSVGTRIVTGTKWDANVDLSHMFWKMKYPAAYGGDGSAVDNSIVGGRKLGPYQGNFLLSVGVSRYFGR